MDNPYQHGQQPPNLDMLAVYGGAKEFSGDGFSFDMSQIPPSGQPLLSGTEQNLITDFFAHPDDFSEHVAFGYYKEPSASNAGSSSMTGPTSHGDPLLHANTSHNHDLQYHNEFSVNSNRNNPRNAATLSAGDINGMATYTQEAMSLNDVAAANTLSGFRNNPANDNSTAFALDGASWGAMSMSGLITHAAAATYASDRQWLQNAAPRPNNEAAQPRDGNGNLIEMVMDDMQRGAYVPAAPPNSNVGRPFGTYGSDTSFSSGNFAGSTTADHPSKSANLLGIPLAVQAAGLSSDGSRNRDNVPVRINHSAQQVPNGRANYGTQLTPQYSDSWNSAVIGSHPGANKRRKSNGVNGVKQEPDSENEEAGGNSKRRKSMASNFQPAHTQTYAPSYNQMQTPQMSYPQGPMMLPPQDMRRAPTRKKENLTDDQKRANHIISEKKRREIINQGYRDLNELTPALAMGKSGLSRSECLTEINNYLYALQLANNRLIKDLQLEPSEFAIPPPASQNSAY